MSKNHRGRVFWVLGLGFGDEGKGSVVDYLARRHDASLIVRFNGGHQAGHTVVLPNGKKHVFSQFGAGTLSSDCQTYLYRTVVIEPRALKNEAGHLELLGVRQPLDRLVIHPGCLVTTRYLRAANCAAELARGPNQHGSCGLGIGATREYWLQHGQDSIFARDLCDWDTLIDKLELQRQRLLEDVRLRYAISKCRENGIYDEWLHTPSSDVADELYEQEFDVRHLYPTGDVMIFEGAQGFWLDQAYGFAPHNTWSDTTFRHAQDCMADFAAGGNTDWDIFRLGVTRIYTTRHGAGPLPTEEKAIEVDLPSDAFYEPNQWQGRMRYGWLDTWLLRGAVNILHEHGHSLDGLALTCYDQFESIADRSSKKLRISTDIPDAPALQHTSPSEMFMCSAQRTSDMYARCCEYAEVTSDELPEMLERMTDVKIALTSYGTTRKSKEWHSLLPVLT